MPIIDFALLAAVMASSQSADLSKLRAELERLRALPPMRKPSFYIGGIFGLCFLGIASIVGVTLARSTQDNTGIVIAIVGFLAPTVGGVVAVMVKDVHVLINSRMTELLTLATENAMAEGRAEAETVAKATALETAITTRAEAAMLAVETAAKVVEARAAAVAEALAASSDRRRLEAASDAATANTVAVAAPLVETILTSIDANTEAIKVNTARTDATAARTESTVQELKDKA